MRLHTLLTNTGITSEENPEIEHITNNSQDVIASSLFVAIEGTSTDGHRFIPQAIEKGATVILGQKDKDELSLPKNIVYLKAENIRLTYAILFCNWYKNPSQSMTVIGVTGTDGKTTTTNILHELLLHAGIQAGLISTVYAKILDAPSDIGLHVTSPDASLVQKLLFEMKERGCTHVVLEVTSHALDQERFGGIHFDVALLTNFTREHLDYHKTIEAYAKAKAKLFSDVPVAIINDQVTEYPDIVSIIQSAAQKTILLSKASLEISLIQAIQSRFPEEYNQQNATLASLAAQELGIDTQVIKESILSFKGIPGRLEEIPNTKGIHIFVDFAHTPHAYASLFPAIRKKYPHGKLIVVFGCAGERDTSKRSIMGSIAATYADVIILTTEDPRHENTKDIIAEIKNGITNFKGELYEIEDRTQAIKSAVKDIAQSGDIILFLGKGVEKSMNFNGVEQPWDEIRTVKEALQ